MRLAQDFYYFLHNYCNDPCNILGRCSIPSYRSKLQGLVIAEDDADWKRIQQKTFTRWCNQQLKVQNVAIEDLNVAFCDGVNLIVLMEVLSRKALGKYNKKPRIQAQKMDNVSKVLDFIMRDEGIKLVNIGMFSEDLAG